MERNEKIMNIITEIAEIQTKTCDIVNKIQSIVFINTAVLVLSASIRFLIKSSTSYNFSFRSLSNCTIYSGLAVMQSFKDLIRYCQVKITTDAKRFLTGLILDFTAKKKDFIINHTILVRTPAVTDKITVVALLSIFIKFHLVSYVNYLDRPVQELRVFALVTLLINTVLGKVNHFCQTNTVFHTMKNPKMSNGMGLLE